MSELLARAKSELDQPLRNARRKLLIILSISYVVLLIVFTTSEKIATGKFVPDYRLYFIYVPAFLLNVFSAFYNIKMLLLERRGTGYADTDSSFIVRNHQRIDPIIGWLSIVPIMAMSFCNLIGLGNPCNDAIFTDYAMAHILIIGAVIVIGRKGAVIWFCIVIAVLVWDTNRLGYDYEYNYLTPGESKEYRVALEQARPEAIARKAELEQSGLNPPKVSRYFNTWIVFIIVAFMAAYYYSGITLDIMKVIPNVTQNIEKAIEDKNRVDVELELKQNEVAKSAMRIVRYNEILEDLNTEIDKLDYTDKRKLSGITSVIKKALDREKDWEKFQTSFDSIHSDFFKILQEKYAFLTQGEMKHLAYIKLNLSSSEISRLMDVKKESLRTLRHRLKKKLNISEDIELRDFVDNIEII